jgi:dolichol-phosphate mannosyltransferase
MAYVAHRLGFKILELPITFEDRRWGRSKMSLRIQLEAAVRVWQVRMAHRRLAPLARA